MKNLLITYYAANSDVHSVHGTTKIQSLMHCFVDMYRNNIIKEII